MEKSDLEQLFAGVLNSPEQDTEPVRRVFYALIQATLKYRDDVMADRGEVVTVGAVRESLDWLPYILAVGNMPDTVDDVCRGLLEVWVAALKET
ncbi:MAG: hypothetical protein JRK53_11930 [Deltaproteobacteria bacterium]|nr:hypothetical protein [Deltaproteobacteria bacterium]MBW1816336.1 hypothetical protein [Deltaproteobacteria bacterium]